MILRKMLIDVKVTDVVAVASEKARRNQEPAVNEQVLLLAYNHIVRKMLALPFRQRTTAGIVVRRVSEDFEDEHYDVSVIGTNTDGPQLIERIDRAELMSYEVCQQSIDLYGAETVLAEILWRLYVERILFGNEGVFAAETEDDAVAYSLPGDLSDSAFALDLQTERIFSSSLREQIAEKFA